MKKILLLISSFGLFLSSIYGQFDYYVYETGGSSQTIEPINYATPPSWLNPSNIAGASFSPSDTNFTNGFIVYELIGVGLNDISGTPILDGKYALDLDVQSAPVLTSVTTAGAYQGAPRVIAVTAGQSNVTDSRDVNIEYGLLLGQGKGEAYLEYWFKANAGASKWENIDNANITGEKEGVVSETGSGYLTATWSAGESSFANNINTSNAQIRVTAKLGSSESGWNGEGDFGGSGGHGGSAGTAIFEIFDVNDMVGVSYWDSGNPGGYANAIDKRDSILGDAALVPVGTYDDGVTTQPVYDFQGKESFRDQFAPGLSGSFYSINDTNIVQVKLPASGG